MEQAKMDRIAGILEEFVGTLDAALCDFFDHCDEKKHDPVEVGNATVNGLLQGAVTVYADFLGKLGYPKEQICDLAANHFRQLIKEKLDVPLNADEEEFSIRNIYAKH